MICLRRPGPLLAGTHIALKALETAQDVSVGGKGGVAVAQKREEQYPVYICPECGMQCQEMINLGNKKAHPFWWCGHCEAVVDSPKERLVG